MEGWLNPDGNGGYFLKGGKCEGFEPGWVVKKSLGAVLTQPDVSRIRDRKGGADRPGSVREAACERHSAT